MLQIYLRSNTSGIGVLTNLQAIGTNIVVIFAAMIIGQFFMACGLLTLVLSFDRQG